MSQTTTETERAGRSLLENVFYGAIVTIGLIGAIAALIASTRSSDKGWTLVVGLVIAMIFAVTILALLYILLLMRVLVPLLSSLVMLIKEGKATGLIPTILATAQVIFIGATNEILNEDPALRWSLGAILAALSLFGSVFATLKKNIGVTIVGVGMVIISAGVIIFSALTNHHWWSNYLTLSVGNQVAIAGAIGVSIIIIISTAIFMATKRG